VPIGEVIAAVEAGFRLKGLGQTQMPPKTAIHPRPTGTFLHAMPAYVGGEVDCAALKWVGGSDGNRARGLPTVSGLIVVNDPDTMLPVCVMDCTWITAMRTAAASAVAMKWLGPAAVAEVAVLGCGVQGRSHLLAMAALYPRIRCCRAWDPDAEALQAYLADMLPRVPFAAMPASAPEAAVRGADIIVTAGPMSRDPHPYVPLDWVKPGAMAVPVDYDAAWQPDALRAMDKLATDDHAQMEYYREQGYFTHTPPPYADLGEIVTGARPGRERPDERTMAMCLGVAINDCVSARLLYRRARDTGLGTNLPL